MRFTLRQIETFAAVASEGSFAAAAERLNISPPAVSDQIAALERRLGCRLFIRRRGAAPLLSPAGLELLETSESVLRETRKFDHSLGVEQSRKEPVKVFLSPYMLDGVVMPRFSEFLQERPNTPVYFNVNINQDEAARLVERRDLDVAIFALQDPVPPPPTARRVAEVPMRLYAGPDIPLSRPTDDLSSLPFILPADPAHERMLLRFLRERGVEPRTVVSRPQFPSVLLNLVKTGVGVSVFTDEIAMAHGLVPICPPMGHCHRVCLMSPSASPEAERVADFLWRLVAPETPDGAGEEPALRRAS